MPDSPSAWLRSLAAEATPTLKWPAGTSAAQIMERRKVEARSGRLLKSMSPDLAVFCADAIDLLEALGNRSGDCPGCDGATHRHDCPITLLLARFAALQPGREEERRD